MYKDTSDISPRTHSQDNGLQNITSATENCIDKMSEEKSIENLIDGDEQDQSEQR